MLHADLMRGKRRVRASVDVCERGEIQIVGVRVNLIGKRLSYVSGCECA